MKGLKLAPLVERVELLPCPFCGGEAVLTVAPRPNPPNHHFVVCADMSCACAMIPRNSENQAVRQWNRRVIALRLGQPANPTPHSALRILQ